jgi:hypothetical protein
MVKIRKPSKRRKMTKRKNENILTRHHIIPTSRGGGSLDNICYVPRIQHKEYHNLFGNRTPEEIIDYLLTDFWNGQTKYIDKYIDKYFKRDNEKFS